MKQRLKLYFQGRISCKNFILSTLLLFLFYFISLSIISIPSRNNPDNKLIVGIVLIIAFSIIFALMFLTLSLLVRRLHDINKSGIWLLIGGVPLIGQFILLYYLLSPGKGLSNAYGNPNSNKIILRDIFVIKN